MNNDLREHSSVLPPGESGKSCSKNNSLLLFSRPVMTPKKYFSKAADSVFKYLIPRLNKRGEELFPLLDQPEYKPHHGRLHRLLEWLVVPPTEWLFDKIGLSK